ncbi:MAG: ArsR/SmtB family transcription factor [Dehalococcoidia bacterium]|nr:putative HTH-type transcriptional regulator [Chloroflexota bacterium]MBT9161470.1 putative HTH-type transcriptional regulator [Chloroflexota bacterium]MBT9163098.1 putative HTH-type transcriptional regulator [Chloroflexota bacterium]
MIVSADERTQIFRLQAELCKSLADPKRLMIIHALREGERSVSKLAEGLGLKQSNASQHLAVMRKAGIITPRRVGSTVYYSLVNPKIAEACDLVRGVLADQIQRNQSLAGGV